MLSARVLERRDDWGRGEWDKENGKTCCDSEQVRGRIRD